jgi:anionic cell wall polymer biosynthesis LytR-Cps2A-Psr (LCP) family protein
MMLSLDMENKRFWIVQVPRDSVALVDIYDEDGNITQTLEAQITVQHGFGNGLKESNDRATKSISRMFYGLPIHSTTSVNMGGVIAVNDAIGGVTVTSLYTFTTFANDYKTNETFVEGETYTLMGTSAYNYVHFRDYTRMNTSSERLARQKQYLNCFFDQAWSSIASNPTKIVDIYNTAMNYVITDLTTSEMVALVSEAAGCTYEGIYMLEGKVRDGQQSGESEHYDLDQSALKEYLINNYYVEAK